MPTPARATREGGAVEGALRAENYSSEGIVSVVACWAEVAEHGLRSIRSKLVNDAKIVRPASYRGAVEIACCIPNYARIVRFRAVRRTGEIVEHRFNRRPARP